MKSLIRCSIALSVAGLLGACSSLYYDALEGMGVHSRDLVMERVGEAKTAQVEAQEQFASALDAFQKAAGTTQDTELEEVYERLEEEYERAQDRAEEVTDRIESVEGASQRLFGEWKKDVESITDDKLRNNAAEQFSRARHSYRTMVEKMRVAASKMDPVLVAFDDRVTYIKSNLNYAAVASLEETLIDIEDDVAALISDMDASIREADEFIDTMGGGVEG